MVGVGVAAMAVAATGVEVVTAEGVAVMTVKAVTGVVVVEAEAACLATATMLPPLQVATGIALVAAT
jgi:hypothetical protein